MALFAKAREPYLRGFLKLKNGPPSHDTFSRLFRNLDPEQFQAAFQRFMTKFSEACQGVVALQGFFNQMKQEYASARWLLYEGLQEDRVHFSDHDVRLCNTLDYSCHSLTVEKTKIAFRMAYSLFDKIAFFLNGYRVEQERFRKMLDERLRA